VNHLERFASGYPKNLFLHLYFNRAGKADYLLTAVVRLKHRTIIVKNSGDNPEALIHTSFERLKLSLNKELNKIRSEHVRFNKNRRINSLSQNLPDLIELKREGSKELLKDLLKHLLNDLAIYIRRRLKTAEMTSAVKRGRFKIQELIDEIYLIIHDRLEEIPRDESAMMVWLHRVADEYLAEKFRELEFEKENLDRIENILEDEYDSLEEKFAMDADFQIVPLEELDEYEDPHPVYNANQLQYGNGEDDIINDLVLKLNEEVIHDKIEKELLKLPVLKRTIMDLYLTEQLTVDEISKIKGISVHEVEEVIKEVNGQLKGKLSFLL
jgi:DNA-directed RNA polymerase specialized sigma24 family protein